MPATLPQSGGGVTFIVTGTGGTVCGVSSLNVSSAWYVPGCTTSGTLASKPTVTSTEEFAGTVAVTGSSDSQVTSATAPQSSSPGKSSESATGVNPPIDPPSL